MDTKDMTRDPSAMAPQPEAADEVFVPEEAPRKAKPRPPRTKEEIARHKKMVEKRRREASKKAKAAQRNARKQEASRSRAEQYHPYKKANDRQKKKRNQEFRQGFQRFFSHQNPVAKIFYKEDPNVFGTESADMRKERRAAEAERKRKRAEQLNTPAVIYTQPAAFNFRRLAIQLMTVLALVLALVLGLSVFFRVEEITVTGAKVYSAWTIREKSGISEGDNLLTFGRTKACGQIIANLPYVKSARIGIKLPNTVNIEIEEESVVYSIQDQDGVWWLINSNGKVIEQTSTLNAKSYTQVYGVTLTDPQPAEFGVATDSAPVVVDETGETIPALITGAQRLNTALRILQELENNDIVGDAASIDVSQLQDIILWYGTRYQVNLGTIDRMDYKIAYMKQAIAQMSDYQTGVLDVSFTTWPDKAGFTPFG